MLVLLLLLLLLSSSSSSSCPCDMTAGKCDVNCCCDVSCSSDVILSFNCTSYLLSDPRLCCKDKLSISPTTGAYISSKTCTSDLTCLQTAPSSFGHFSSSSSSSSFPTLPPLRANLTTSTSSLAQYTDSDVLLRNVESTPFMFPVQFYGDTCVSSPILYYAEHSSSCRCEVSAELCETPSSLLHYTSYIQDLLSYPGDNATSLDLSTNLTFLCVDEEAGIREACYADQLPPAPSLSGDKCLNVVKGVSVRLVVEEEYMRVAETAVVVTLSAVSVTESSHMTQQFQLTYRPVSGSGNYGYRPGSPILSGRVEDGRVSMSEDPAARPFSLFKSSDCQKFSSHGIEFGVGFYTGCKLQLPFYNIATLPSTLTEYCHALRNITARDVEGLVVGVTGRADVTDTSQWVLVQEEPLPPSGEASDTAIRCDDVITHSTYKIYYTEVGDSENLQAVITHVRVQHSRQHVVLFCGGSYCPTTKQQSILLSNSVQFVYNTPSTQERYKVKPTTTIMLPLDFFYPLTSSSSSSTPLGLLVLCTLIPFYSFSLL